MALYLIAFNDEWVPDLTSEELREERGLRRRCSRMNAAGGLLLRRRRDRCLDGGVQRREQGREAGFHDGPFVETKEHLGGFTVVDVPDDEAARYWAGRLAVSLDWPQEVHRFPHRLALSTDTRGDASS